MLIAVKKRCGKKCGKKCGKDFGGEARCVIISVRAEGGLMRKRETRKAMTRYAWEAVNVPAIRCLYTTWSVYGV